MPASYPTRYTGFKRCLQKNVYVRACQRVGLKAYSTLASKLDAMAVSADVQIAVSQRYAQLADSVTHGHDKGEREILAPHFSDTAKIKLSAYEYDPLTVLVQNIQVNGSTMTVHAQYIGVQQKRENTVDRWLLLDGVWRLAERDKPRP